MTFRIFIAALLVPICVYGSEKTMDLKIGEARRIIKADKNWVLNPTMSKEREGELYIHQISGEVLFLLPDLGANKFASKAELLAFEGTGSNIDENELFNYPKGLPKLEPSIGNLEAALGFTPTLADESELAKLDSALLKYPEPESLIRDTTIYMLHFLKTHLKIELTFERVDAFPSMPVARSGKSELLVAFDIYREFIERDEPSLSILYGIWKNDIRVSNSGKINILKRD